jgi:hypothetical protein
VKLDEKGTCTEKTFGFCMYCITRKERDFREANRSSGACNSTIIDISNYRESATAVTSEAARTPASYRTIKPTYTSGVASKQRLISDLYGIFFCLLYF